MATKPTTEINRDAAEVITPVSAPTLKPSTTVVSEDDSLPPDPLPGYFRLRLIWVLEGEYIQITRNKKPVKSVDWRRTILLRRVVDLPFLPYEGLTLVFDPDSITGEAKRLMDFELSQDDINVQSFRIEKLQFCVDTSGQGGKFSASCHMMFTSQAAVTHQASWSRCRFGFSVIEDFERPKNYGDLHA